MQKCIIMTNNGETEEVKIISELLIHDKHMKQGYMYCISIIF